MSSRIYRRDDAVEAVPIAWRPVDGAAGPAARPLSTEAATAVPKPSAEQEREIEMRIRAAHQQARAEGEAAGLQQARQRLEPAFAALNNILQDLSGARKKIRAEAERDTLKLALAIARRILHREIATDPEALLGLVKSAFDKLNARETQRLRMAPSDAAVIQEYRGKLALPPGLEIVSDTYLESGSAVFETNRGELDASVDTQLAEVERGLTDVLRRRA